MHEHPRRVREDRSLHRFVEKSKQLHPWRRSNRTRSRRQQHQAQRSRQPLESKQRKSTPVGQRYIRVVDDHGTESCAKFQIYQKASAGWWNLDTRWCSDKQSKRVTYQTTPITGRTHSNTVPTTLICGYTDAREPSEQHQASGFHRRVRDNVCNDRADWTRGTAGASERTHRRTEAQLERH